MQSEPIPQSSATAEPSGPSDAAGQLASWGNRAVAFLWDALYVLPAFVVAVCGQFLVSWGRTIPEERLNTDPERIGLIVLLSGLAWGLVRLARNRFLDQGKTGWSYGKRKVGIRALNASTGKPIGVSNAIFRDLINGVLNIVVFISYLWALSNPRHQTLGDKFFNVTVATEADPEGVRPFTRSEDSTGGDLVAGAMFIFLGGGFAYGAAGYNLRSFSNPGPGLFPVLVGLIIAILGVVIFVRSLMGKGEVTPGLSQFPWRALSLLSASLIFFAFVIEDLGLVFTAIGTALLASFASPTMTIVRAALTSLGIGLLSYLLFGLALQLSIPSFPWGG